MSCVLFHAGLPPTGLVLGKRSFSSLSALLLWNHDGWPPVRAGVPARWKSRVLCSTVVSLVRRLVTDSAEDGSRRPGEYNLKIGFSGTASVVVGSAVCDQGPSADGGREEHRPPLGPEHSADSALLEWLPTG